jgi:hypothetical protein
MLIFILALSSVVQAATLPALDLNIQPGQINEVTRETGNVSADTDQPFPIAYSLGYLTKNGNKVYIFSQHNVAEVTNTSELSVDFMDSEVAYQSDPALSFGVNEIKILRISALEQNHKVPLFWCSSTAKKLTENLSETFFFRIDETSAKRDEKHRLQSVQGEIVAWIYRHPPEIIGVDRFQEKYLVNGQPLRSALKSISPFDIEGFLAMGIKFADGGLNRINGVWVGGLSLASGQEIGFSRFPDDRHGQLDNMNCLRVRGR